MIEIPDTSALPCEVHTGVPLGPLTTFGVGGPAEYYVAPRTADELAGCVRWARDRDVDWFVLGTGANILVTDAGIPGLVIHNRAQRMDIDGTRMVAESGSVFADMILAAEQSGLSGIEHYVGIPSTLGGAMWQNLHFLSPDRTRTMFIAEVVERATILPADADAPVEVDVDYFQFGYDDSILHHRRDVVLDVTLALARAPHTAIRETLWRNAHWRATRHPFGATRCSAGSIFQKIDGVGAGRLIDAAGLKGYRIGGAVVSPHHANFILNTGGATASDVLALIEHVREAVERDSGYRLEPEISVVGSGSASRAQPETPVR